MTHLRIKKGSVRLNIVSLIADSLLAGQVLVLPTDTIYGLSCSADNVRAIKKIYQLKKRDKKKPVLVLVSSLEMAKKYVYLSKQQEELVQGFWSKKEFPTTLILKNKNRLPKELVGESDGLAVRLPKSRFLIKIIERLGCPIVSTSLNFSGDKEAMNLSELITYFPKKSHRPDLVIDNGPALKSKSSRLIDIRSIKKIEVIRP
jgi:L-threonylcarbamoyladenylate synthase